MIKINLLPHKKLKPLEKGLLKLRAIIVGIIILVALGLAFGVYFFHSSLGELRDKNVKAAKELDVIKGKVKEAEAFEKSRLELETKLNTIRELEKKKIPLTPLLDEINKAMPKDVWLTKLEKTGISFTLGGFGRDSEKSVNGFVAKLKESPVFKDIVLDDVKESDSKTPGVTMYAFTVKGKLAGYAEETPQQAPPAEAVTGKGAKAPAGKAPAGKAPAVKAPAVKAPAVKAPAPAPAGTPKSK